MRETNNLKRFRAWVQDSNKSPFYMVKVSTLTWDIGRIGYIVNENVCIPPEHLMQSTGLHDKNGKEIFESDIVARYVINRRSGKEVESWRGEVVMEHGEWKALTEGLWRLQNKVAVIGNVYESPELLEEKL